MAGFNSHSTMGLGLWSFFTSKFYEKPTRQNYLYATFSLMI